MPNLFKRKQVWFQVLVYSRFHKSPIPWRWPGTAQNLKIRPSLTILRHWAQTRDCGARSTFWRETHFLGQLFSAVRNIHKTKSATCFHCCCRAHHRYSQTIAIPLSLLGSYLQVQFAIWLCHYGRRCHYLFSSFAIFGCSGNTTNKTMLYTKCS